jgi:hypothetical protein
MIGQYLPNNNETVTVTFRQKKCQLNSPLIVAGTIRLPQQANGSATV